MDYKKIYESLIERSKGRNIIGYTEKHHIVPRCMGGSDDAENLATLTPEEHYVAHQLLVKIYPGNHKLICAAQMMIPNRPSNKLYGWLRRKFSEVMKEQTGEKNSQFGTCWVVKNNAALKINKEELQEYILNGWCLGRVEKKIKVPKEKVIKEKVPRVKAAENRVESKKETYRLLDKYLESEYTSLNLFCKYDCHISVVALTKRFMRHVDGYKTASLQGGHYLKEQLREVRNSGR